jgi:dTMP kinase
MINIYFTATTSNDTYKKNYKTIITKLEKIKGVKVISGQQILKKSLLSKDKKLASKKIFEREKSLIHKADVVIAEVTQPSTGVGGEIVYALIQKKPVLALIFEEHEDAITPMLEGNPSEKLYLEHYTVENLHLKLQDFLDHAKTTQHKGKLIVIDGGDGSGKATQAKLLIDYLKKKKFKVKSVDFPQYYSSFSGKTVAMFLRGEFGELNAVSPYLASMPYALDRASVKEEMEEFLNKGGIIIANRYATSNMAHQSAKFASADERKKYLDWVYELEYKVLKIPKEDIVVYLYVPWKIGYELTKNKGDRAYLKGQSHDIAEADLKHREDAEKMYLQLAKEKGWIQINCTENDKLLSIEEIHRKLLSHLTFI